MFILGAGASAEYGFPLGSGLVQRIVEGTGSGGQLRDDLERAGYKREELNEFSRKLRDSDQLSIDTFLEGNECNSFQAIGKAAIAISILQAEHASRKQEKFIGRNVPADHWLRYIWNLMRSDCDSADEFAKNQVSFVTFNYDRVVEWYFQIVLENAFNLPGPTEARDLFAKTVPMVHLHGTIADREFGQYSGRLGSTEVQAVAKGIRVVHDPASERPFTAAWELFKKARLVCILGFGYHPTNIDRLRLKDFVEPSAQMPASTYNMGGAQVSVAYSRIQHRGLGISNLPAARDYKAERFLKEIAQLV
ncbi:MAG TPA: hypothetical protein VMH32_15605 [Burkholderiales bacterium]|nr:hypothetical protein [Burkholderiales bacterium]